MLEVAPEIAVVMVSVTARDRDRGRALSHLEQRRDALQRIVRSYAGAVEKVEGGAVQVHPEFKDGKTSERVASYVAISSFRVTICDFEVLARLVGALTDQDLVTVTGPFWRLRPDSPSFRQARLEAVRDALGRARDYAEAVGSRVTELLELSDAGPLMRGGVAFEASPMSAGGGPIGGPASAEPAQFDFTPQLQTIRGHVEARFEMTRSSLD